MIDLILEIELCVGDRRGAKTDRSKWSLELYLASGSSVFTKSGV
jgi:hypothetical protein